MIDEKKWNDSEDYQNKWLDELKTGGKQMKLNKKFFMFLGGLLLTLVVLFAFLVGGRKKEYVGEPDSDATSPKVGKEEYFKIKIYDLHNPSNVASKEVNLYDLTGKENTYRVAQYYDPFTRNGKDYLPIWMSSYEKGKAEKNKYLIFSLDTGKIEKEMSEKEIKQLLDQKDTKVYSEENLYESMDWSRGGIGEQISNELLKYGIEKVTGYLVQSFDKDDSVDVSGTNFSKLYPEISTNIKEMNKIYFRPEQYNEEEWFNDLIHWFAPEGQDVMELYATDETTGEKTQIRSFNDFKQWVESHPQKEN
ncbi:hypothetical protein D8880_04410 [Streptococcus sanguinis]|uniref:hypothetical protein n=1 Tax=Streptococcus sanguinis TaxID=1305 RepID=UPI000FC35EC9|nr:hypothetical protein D8880_04410 [Streptococcus sanguinis]